MKEYETDIFEETAEYYARFRPAYPAKFFDKIITEFDLDGRGTLLDLGCGTGEIAIPLAPYFDKVYGWDPVADMLAQAEQKAKKAKVSNITWQTKSSKDLYSIDFSLRLVTMGQSFHWMNQRNVLEQLRGLLEKGGGIVIIGTEPAEQDKLSRQKNTIIDKSIKKYLGPERRAGSGTYNGPQENWEELLPKAGFSSFKSEIYIENYTSNIDEVIGYLFSLSYAKRSLFEGRDKEFEEEVRRELNKLNPSGKFEDKVKYYFYTLVK